MIYNLHTPRRRRLTRLIIRGKPSSVAKYCLSDRTYTRGFITELSKILKQEIKNTCSVKVQSILRSKEPYSLESFIWDKVTSEAETHAPLLFNLLVNCTVEQPSQMQVIGYIIAILCNLKWNQMNLPQKLISLILYAGNCSKQVCLNKI